ncbi:MAG TPA: esterase-like activity of phytase family protein [Hyphomonadaceae bacterium]|nr:esterase-like activity of phytase family protein [Hyphomonadaceae bacterium]
MPLKRIWLIGAAIIAAACAADPVAVPSPAAPVAQTTPALPRDAAADLIAQQRAYLDTTASSPAPLAPAAGSGRTIEAYIAQLRDTSCPDGVKKTEPEKISLKADPVPLQGLNPSRKTIGQLTYVAGYHLTSTDDRFGGLSDIRVMDDGSLLTVSDVGRFVWLDMAKDGVTPIGARISQLHDARGGDLTKKGEADSEGLAVNDGVALVSFERDHRVLAYDLARCGASARGAPIVFGGYGRPIPQAFADAKITVDENSSLEALGVTPDWYMFSGIETKVGDESPMSARPIEAPPQYDLRLGEGAPVFVGLDLLVSKDGSKVRTFDLHRSFNPLSGNAIAINETDFERYLDQSNLPARVVSDIDERSHYRYRKTGARRLADFNFLVTIDNFEGIAAKPMPDGRIRLYVISDDNFSSTQRTLLMIFDLK